MKAFSDNVEASCTKTDLLNQIEWSVPNSHVEFSISLVVNITMSITMTHSMQFKPQVHTESTIRCRTAKHTTLQGTH